MRVYVDFDDVLCETARNLNVIAHRLFGTNVTYDEMKVFDLDKSFSLNPEQYKQLMQCAHSDAVLSTVPETPGATATLHKWLDEGHEIEIVTGRSFATRHTSRAWLAQRGLGDLPILHVNKFNREKMPKDPAAPRPLTIEEFCDLKYDFAIEDSPMGLRHLTHIKGCHVAAFARPWNESLNLPPPLFRRCADWKEIDAYFSSLQDDADKAM